MTSNISKKGQDEEEKQEEAVLFLQVRQEEQDEDEDAAGDGTRTKEVWKNVSRIEATLSTGTVGGEKSINNNTSADHTKQNEAEDDVKSSKTAETPLQPGAPAQQTIQDTNSSSPTSTTKFPHRKELSMSLKLFLSPNATIKAHRKANYLYRHSHDKIDTNLMILLHGAGDTHQPYHALAKKMNIPQCASLSIHASSIDQGFSTLPFQLGHTWFAEMDYTTGQPLHRNNFKLTTSLDKAVHHLQSILSKLTDSDNLGGGWLPERIFIFGYSAGACLAMETCIHRTLNRQLPLGGAVCIAGGVHTAQTHTHTSTAIQNENTCQSQNQTESAATATTPVLIIGGSADQTFPPSKVHAAVHKYNSFTAKDTGPGAAGQAGSGAGACGSINRSIGAKSFIVPGKGDGMIQSEAETKAIMEFCAEHMVRRMVHMEGFCEITPDHLSGNS